MTKGTFVELARDSEVPEEYQNIITKMVNSLVDYDFCNGWFGDSSEKFREREISSYINSYKYSQKTLKKRGYKSQITHPNLINSHLFNLGRYCGWNRDDLLVLAENLGASQEEIDKIKMRAQFEEIRG